MIKNKWLRASTIVLCFAGTVAQAAELPKDIKWLTADDLPEWSSSEGKPGGTYNGFLSSFPLTLRLVGPDSNGGFAGIARSLSTYWGLIAEHPNMEETIIPQLAVSWAFGNDDKSMYFKLDPNARWSDGKKITADDYLYTLEFYRSKEIVAPWYNNYYTEQIDKVIKYDDYTISVHLVNAKPEPERHRMLALNPTPKHFYGKLGKNFVKRYNWKIRPNPGPYEIDKVKKGRSITIKRKKNWWMANRRYYRNRFYVNTYRLKVIRDPETAFLRFLKGELDSFGLTRPGFWYDKAKTKEFEKGWIHKIKFYNDVPQPTIGLWINTSRAPYGSKKVRHAIAHAINFDRLNRTVLRGDYERLHAFYTGAGKYMEPNVRAREYSCDKVSENLTADGWARGPQGFWAKNGKRLAPELLYSSELQVQRLVVLKEEAKKCGIELKLRLLQGAQGFKAALERKFEIAFIGMSGGRTPSPRQFMHSSNAKTQTNNFVMMEDKKMDELIERLEASGDVAERVKLAHEIQRKWHEFGAWIPLYMVPYFRQGYWRYLRFPDPPATKDSDSVTDLLGTTTGGLFWIDEKLKEETVKAVKADKALKPVVIEDTTYRPNKQKSAKDGKG